MRPLLTFILVVLATVVSALRAAEPPIAVSEPLITPIEKVSTSELARRGHAHVFWNERNRAIGIALTGIDANDQTVAVASNLPALKTMILLTLRDSALSDNGLERISRHPNLELLSITGDRISDAGLRHIVKMKNLRTLILKGNFTDAGVTTIFELRNLEHLDLTQARITDSGLTQLTKLPNLKTLILNGTRITNETIERIAQIKTLEWLCLGETLIDDSAVGHLKQLGELKLLNVMNTGITPDGIEAMCPAFFDDCRIIDKTSTYFGTRGRRPELREYADSLPDASEKNQVNVARGE